MFLTKITDYWNSVAEEYSNYICEDLNGENGELFADILEDNAPYKDKISCLDLGCGPGFCSVLLAKAGYNVTALDCSESMLNAAKSNFEKFGVNAKLIQGDVHKLEFNSGSFDYIVARNLVWNLEDPKKAYKEWFRVLKKDGRLLISDGNYFLHYFDKDYKALYKKSVKAGETAFCDIVDMQSIENIIRNLPLTVQQRPEWDFNALFDAGAKSMQIYTDNLKYSRPCTGIKRSLINDFIICASKDSPYEIE